MRETSGAESIETQRLASSRARTALRRRRRCEDGRHGRAAVLTFEVRADRPPAARPAREPRRRVGGAAPPAPTRASHATADAESSAWRAPAEARGIDGAPGPLGGVDAAAARRGDRRGSRRDGARRSRLRLTFAPPRLFVAVEPFTPLRPRGSTRGRRLRDARHPPRQPALEGHALHRDRAAAYARLPEGSRKACSSPTTARCSRGSRATSSRSLTARCARSRSAC